MTRTLKTILIGTSLTERSDAGVCTGVALARATGASAWLIHAYQPYIPLGFPPGGGMDAQWAEEQVKSLQELLIGQARRTGLSDLAGFSPGQLRLVAGAPHQEITELAERIGAGLIVVGASEGRGILGSTADRVIRKAPCPVLAVRSESAFPPRRVEIAVDLSPSSASALRQGLDFLAQLGSPVTEAEVLLVLSPFEAAGSVHFTREQVQHFATEELRRFVAANASEELRPRLARVRTGYPREEILAELKERQVDLAVLGTHGSGGFERLMIGSIAAGVLRDASCNLLIVPPGAVDETREEPASADWSYISDEDPVVAGRS